MQGKYHRKRTESTAHCQAYALGGGVASRTEFVRPMHWPVLLHGDTVVDANVMGIQFGRTSHVHSAGDITISSPADYREHLRTSYVMTDFSERCKWIRSQVEATAEQAGGQAVIDTDQFNEVTALNEWPTALLGRRCLPRQHPPPPYE